VVKSSVTAQRSENRYLAAKSPSHYQRNAKSRSGETQPRGVEVLGSLLCPDGHLPEGRFEPIGRGSVRHATSVNAARLIASYRRASHRHWRLVRIRQPLMFGFVPWSRSRSVGTVRPRIRSVRGLLFSILPATLPPDRSASRSALARNSAPAAAIRGVAHHRRDPAHVFRVCEYAVNIGPAAASFLP
jgi:hypothetical protein